MALAEPFTPPIHASSGAAASGSLVGLVAEIERFEVATASESEVLGMIRQVARCARLLDAQALRLGARLELLGRSGDAIPVQDAFAGAARMSDGNARKAARRSALANYLSRVGARFQTGDIPVENLDAIAEARHKLRHNPDWVDSFDRLDPSLARRAATKNPRSFRRWVTRVVNMISTNDSEQVTAESANSVRTWTDNEGRVRTMVNLDPEAGARFLHALDTQSKSLSSRRKQAGEQFHHDENHRARAFIELFTGTNAGFRQTIRLPRQPPLHKTRPFPHRKPTNN